MGRKATNGVLDVDSVAYYVDISTYTSRDIVDVASVLLW